MRHYLLNCTRKHNRSDRLSFFVEPWAGRAGLCLRRLLFQQIDLTPAKRNFQSREPSGLAQPPALHMILYSCRPQRPGLFDDAMTPAINDIATKTPATAARPTLSPCSLERSWRPTVSWHMALQKPSNTATRNGRKLKLLPQNRNIPNSQISQALRPGSSLYFSTLKKGVSSMKSPEGANSGKSEHGQRSMAS